MKAQLDAAWLIRDKHYAEWAKHYAEWTKHYAEWAKHYAEWTKHYAEGNLIFIDEVIRLCGRAALVEWDAPGVGDCTVQGVMVFYKT